MTIADLFERNVKYYPNKTAFVFEGQVHYSFSEYNARVNRLINALKSAGIAKGERIVGVLQNTPELLEVFGAAEKGGFIAVPVNPRFSTNEVLEILYDAEPAVVVVGDEHLEDIGLNANLPCSVKLILYAGERPVKSTGRLAAYRSFSASGGSDEPGVDVREDDLVYLIYTSGTTGKPKGVMIDHRGQIENNKTTIIEMRISQGDSLISPLPLNHLGGRGLVSNYFARGCTNYVQKKFDVEEMLRLISHERITTLAAVPAMLYVIINHPHLDSYDLTSLKTIFYSGSTISPALLERCISRFGNALIQFYGMTEAGPIIAVLPKEDHCPEEANRKLRSAGIAAFSNKIRVVDDNGVDVRVGQVGEVIVKTPAVMRGYWKKPDMTAETLRNGWLHTGDLAMIDEQNYIYIVDRKKDMIISGGENIYAREVEDVIQKIPGVREVAVIGVPHEKWGETVKAVVVLEDGCTLLESEIIEHCRKNLASYKKPTSVSFVSELPRNAVGKIQKHVLRDEFRHC